MINMDEFRHLPQLALNLRWIGRRAGKAPDQWAREIVRMTRKTISSHRAVGLLHGADPTVAELAVLVDVTGFEKEELLSVPLYTRERPLFAQNLRHLVDSIPHGQGRVAASRVGITEGQLSRWKKWADERKPHQTNVRKLLKFHGMDPDIDLDDVPLFLSMEPISGYSQKAWLSARVQEMSPSEVAALYPALRKLLRSDEAN